jgi:HlyD family secretion protein
MKWTVALLALSTLTSCGQKRDDAWLGYAEGDQAMIAAPQAGWVESMKMERGKAVHRGDVLFVLDDTREAAGRDQAAASLQAARAALAQARSSLIQEQANLGYTLTELGRQDRLAQEGIGTPTQRDAARNAFAQSQARIGQLQAQIAQTQAQIAQMQAGLGSASYALSQRQIVAQTEGAVQDIYFREGEYVPASTPVLSVLPPANVFVRFFVPESQLSHAHLGQKVRIACDGCQPIDATISFIAAQQEFTPPVIFSNESRDKLVFKLEARAPGGLNLHPGQPVQVRPL